MNSKLIQVDRVQLIKNAESLKAFVSIKIADAFIVQNLRVVQGSKGLFVSMPQEKGKGEGNEEKYFDTVFPTTKAHREELTALVLAAYKEKEQSSVKA